MNDSSTEGVDAYLIRQIRAGDEDAWAKLIDRYEGRLLAYADSRIRNRASSEDIVQEAFVGFLISLPNYDGSRPLESYLFSICAYKLTDHLRREGRRPALQLGARGSDEASRGIDLAGSDRMASSIVRSVERKRLEEQAVAEAIAEQIERWKSAGNFQKLKILELLFVVGMPNKEVAAKTDSTEQQIANYKSDFLLRIKSIIKRQEFDESVFPELAS